MGLEQGSFFFFGFKETEEISTNPSPLSLESLPSCRGPTFNVMLIGVEKLYSTQQH